MSLAAYHGLAVDTFTLQASAPGFTVKVREDTFTVIVSIYYSDSRILIDWKGVMSLLALHEITHEHFQYPQIVTMCVT